MNFVAKIQQNLSVCVKNHIFSCEPQFGFDILAPSCDGLSLYQDNQNLGEIYEQEIRFSGCWCFASCFCFS
jgi:hypothetical protein